MPGQFLDNFNTGYSLANQLFPLKRPHLARRLPINLAASASYAAGLVLAQSTASANDVQTITLGGTPTGGAFSITALNGQVVTPAYNVTTAALQALLAPIYGSANIAVTGTAGTSYILTFSAGLANQPVPLITVTAGTMTSGTTATASVAHTTQGQTVGTFAAYAGSGGSNGLNVAKGFLEMACTTDGGGNVTFSPTSSSAPYNINYSTAPMFSGGIFDVSKLTGLDANALTNLGAHLESGVVAGPGVVVVP